MKLTFMQIAFIYVFMYANLRLLDYKIVYNKYTTIYTIGPSDIMQIKRVEQK